MKMEMTTEMIERFSARTSLASTKKAMIMTIKIILMNQTSLTAFDSKEMLKRMRMASSLRQGPMQLRAIPVNR